MSVSYIPDESPFADRTALEQWARENLDELRNDDDSVTYVSVTTDSVADLSLIHISEPTRPY